MSTRLRVRYAETDKMGVVYYANYLVWFEVARCEFLRAQGYSYRELEASGVALPVIEADCRYLHPIRYDDEVEITAHGRLLSPARVEFSYAVVRLEDGIAAAHGRTVHAAVNLSGRPCRLPPHIRTVLS